MHQTTYAIVTFSCNPETFTNTYSVLGCVSQCDNCKTDKIPYISEKNSRFPLSINPPCASLESSDEARPIYIDQTEKNHIGITGFQAHLVSQSHSGNSTTPKSVRIESLLFEHTLKRRKLCRTPKLKSNIQDKHRNSNKRFALRKSSIL